MVLDLKVILPKKIEKKHVRIFKKLHEDCLVLQILTINVKHALNLVFYPMSLKQKRPVRRLSDIWRHQCANLLRSD